MNLPKISDALRTNAYDQYMMQSKLVDDRTWACCANCYSEKDGKCPENGNLQIPIKVAVLGCAKWDGLPF